MADELVTKRITTYGAINYPTEDFANDDVLFVDGSSQGTRKVNVKAILNALNGDIDKAIKSSNVSVTTSNYSSIITNVNDQPINSIYAYAAGLQSNITNLPSNEALSILHYTYKIAIATGIGQVMIAAERSGTNATMYFRTTGGSPVAWSSWQKLANSADVVNNENEINNLKSAIDEIREIKVGKNLIDPDTLTVGALQADGTISTTSSWANYYTTDFIQIDANTDYTFTAYDKTTHAVVEKRILCMLYNASKVYIAASYQNVNNAAKLTIDGDNGAYVRFSSPNAYVYQLEKGDTSTGYEQYNKRMELLINLGEVPTEHIADMVDKQIGEFVYALNLVDPNTLTTGAIQADGTVSNASGFAAYSTTDFIPLDANTDYTFSIFNKTTHDAVTQRKMCMLYDAAKTHIAASYQNVNNAEKVSISSGDAAYMRLSAPTLYDMQLEEGDETSSYIGYEKTMNTKLGGDALEQVKSVTPHDNLKEKKWAVCGDSFTSGATTTKISSGVYAGQNYVYPYLIGNRTGIEVIRFFASGRTLAYPAEPGTFTNSLTNPNDSMYYQNIPSDVDYITIYLGINDEHHSSSSSGGDGEDNTGIIPLGTVDDNTTATYLGAWNVVLAWLIANRPNAHIGMIVTNGNANKDEYRQGQIAIAEKYGIPYIDLNGDARTPAMLRTSNPNIASAVKTALINKWAVDPTSNTHPNDAAHLFESTCIENFLRSL